MSESQSERNSTRYIQTKTEPFARGAPLLFLFELLLRDRCSRLALGTLQMRNVRCIGSHWCFWRRRWGRGSVIALAQPQVGVLGIECQLRSTFADVAGCRFVFIAADFDWEIGDDVAIVGAGIDGLAGSGKTSFR